MAEHAEKPDTTPDTTEDAEKPAGRTSDVDWAQAKDRFVSMLAAVVRWLCLIFALILVLHIVFVVAEANPDNGIVEFMESWANRLTLGFKDLFVPEDPKLRTLANFGIAAVVWLVISAVGANIIRRVGGVSK